MLVSVTLTTVVDEKAEPPRGSAPPPSNDVGAGPFLFKPPPLRPSTAQPNVGGNFASAVSFDAFPGGGPDLHESAAISSNFHGDPPAAATPQAVVDRRELAFIAVERTHMPMVMTDMRQPDAPIVMANTAFLNLTGYDADEVVGRNCRFLQGPDTSALAIAELRTAIDQGQEITTTLLNYRKDGESFWNELHLSPIRDDAGEVIYVFGSQRDVSDRRRAQILAASEHRLLREVDHRAMNVLALVNGIVRLSNADNAARYAASVQHRVDSLARAHRLLAEQGWRSLLLSEIFASQLEPFGASRIALVGAALRAPAIVVQPLSLVVHELLSNAVTHGALSQSDGRVEVRWRHVEANLVEIVWEEHGAALDKSMGPAGFGFSTIEGVIERQLRGGLQRAWTGGGLTTTMLVPFEEA
jgi:PAS domain S-box-containing protein